MLQRTFTPIPQVPCGANISRMLAANSAEQAQRRCCAAAPSSDAPSSSRSDPKSETMPPWAFGFQLNERYLDWDAAAHTQLLKIACAEKLGVQIVDVEQRLVELGALVPDLAQKLGKMKADMLIRLLTDTEKLAERLTLLRGLLPTVDVSKLVSRLPAIALDYEAEDLAKRIELLRRTFGDRTDVEFLVAREPALLRCAESEARLDALLAGVRRLLPVGDALGFVISNPGLVLDMDSADLPSAIDGDLTQEGT